MMAIPHSTSIKKIIGMGDALTKLHNFCVKESYTLTEALARYVNNC